jgi:hypothetical protein
LCLARDALFDLERLGCSRLANARWLRAGRLAAALRPIPLKSTSDATVAASQRFMGVIIEFSLVSERYATGIPVVYRNISGPAVDGEAGVR